MKDFNKPIRPIKNDDEDTKRKKNILEKIEYKKNNSAQKKPGENNKNFILTYIHLVKNFFLSLVKARPSISSNDILHKLKEDFLYMIDHNPKEDLAFAKRFSQNWKELVELEKTRVEPRLHQLIDSVNHFEKEGSQSLHYYLTHYSGEDWFPLPFFELIEALHLNYLQSQTGSDLDRWISLLDELKTQ